MKYLSTLLVLLMISYALSAQHPDGKIVSPPCSNNCNDVGVFYDRNASGDNYVIRNLSEKTIIGMVIYASNGMLYSTGLELQPKSKGGWSELDKTIVPNEFAKDFFRIVLVEKQLGESYKSPCVCDFQELCRLMRMEACTTKGCKPQHEEIARAQKPNCKGHSIAQYQSRIINQAGKETKTATAANNPVNSQPGPNANQTDAMAQLQRTKTYAESQIGAGPKQSVDQSIRDFGAALQSYTASRERDRERRENFREARTQEAYEYIKCLTDKYMDENFVSVFKQVSCDYARPSNGNKTDWGEMKGKIDSVIYYYDHKEYQRGTRVISNEAFRQRMKESDAGSFLFKTLNAGRIVPDIEGLFVFTSYMRLYDFDHKEKQQFLKRLAKSRSSYTELLGAGISALFHKHDTVFASYCFKELLSYKCPKYFFKSASLFQGLIKKSQAIASRDTAALVEAYLYLDDAYNITRQQFMEAGTSFSSGNLQGLFIYPEYNRLLQLAIMEEMAHCLDWEYTLGGDKKAIWVAKDYFLDFFDTTK